MHIHFILVSPAVPENIGAAARALKTMGFSSLRLVNPINYPDEKALWLAHGSDEILRNALIFTSFEESIRDIDFIIGTTSKKRKIKHNNYTPENLLDIIQNKGQSVNAVAIVFGCEESGLTNTELQCCHILTSIPMKVSYPSLNLAQAVMIYAYALSPLSLKIDENHKQAVNKLSFNILKHKVDDILEFINIKKNPALHSRIMERLDLLGEEDIHLLHSIVNSINKKIAGRASHSTASCKEFNHTTSPPTPPLLQERGTGGEAN
ncbi:MAG: tRNA/rRNA methyltransferase [Bacteroidetes bacterium]|nr:tRNA/rRNA methyltransferase [Bacteroidota bacterium]